MPLTTVLKSLFSPVDSSVWSWYDKPFSAPVTLINGETVTGGFIMRREQNGVVEYREMTDEERNDHLLWVIR
jgi:hypothetical protein